MKIPTISVFLLASFSCVSSSLGKNHRVLVETRALSIGNMNRVLRKRQLQEPSVAVEGESVNDNSDKPLLGNPLPLNDNSMGHSMMNNEFMGDKPPMGNHSMMMNSEFNGSTNHSMGNHPPVNNTFMNHSMMNDEFNDSNHSMGHGFMHENSTNHSMVHEFMHENSTNHHSMMNNELEHDDFGHHSMDNHSMHGDSDHHSMDHSEMHNDSDHHSMGNHSMDGPSSPDNDFEDISSESTTSANSTQEKEKASSVLQMQQVSSSIRPFFIHATAFATASVLYLFF